MNIEIKKLNKSFNKVTVLQNLNATIYENKINCLIGSSGSGKTTLLNIIMGLLKQDSGEISGLEKIKLSAVFQENRLCDHLNVLKNLRIVLNNSISDEEINASLEEIGLNDCLYKPIAELSGGMKRRVAILRAVLYNADMIIMDEPLKGLDDATKTKVISFIKKKCVNKTILFVTHDLREIEELNAANLINL